jgi:hypothetical protein
MIQNKFIFFWGVFLSVLAMISPITTAFIDLLPGILLMWFFYSAFLVGSLINKKKILVTVNPEFYIINSSKSSSLILAISALIFYPLYIQFYTGNDVASVFANLFTGKSNYQLYQEHFAGEKLGTLNFAKLPFILLNGFFKFIFVATVFRVFGFQRKALAGEVFLISIMVIMTLLVSLSRGTSFELFELIIVFVFGNLIGRSRVHGKNWFSKKALVYFGILGAIFIAVFSININLRMGGRLIHISEQMQFDQQSIIAYLFPGLSAILYQMSGYFSFGIYFTSVGLTQLNLESWTGFFAMFIPDGLNVFGIGEDYVTLMCGKYLDCGTSWIPDMALHLNQIGLILLTVIVTFLGFSSRRLFIKMHNGSIAAAVLLYFIALYMVSLPIGNFISSSSSNMLGMSFALALLYFPKLNRILFKKPVVA